MFAPSVECQKYMTDIMPNKLVPNPGLHPRRR
jgi:hypothetical protein